MTTYHLVGKPFKNFLSYRLPFPFDSHANAEQHNICLGGGYLIIEVDEADTETKDEREERQEQEWLQDVEYREWLDDQNRAYDERNK